MGGRRILITGGAGFILSSGERVRVLDDRSRPGVERNLAWLAAPHIQAMQGRPITLYGDGKQVRDVLFVDDLMDAFLAARERPREVAGRAFNVGGGAAQTTSLLELLDLVAELRGARPRVTFDDWRLADQRWYVSDPAALGRVTGWAPRTAVRDGVGRLHAWLEEQRRAARAAPVPEATT